MKRKKKNKVVYSIRIWNEDRKENGGPAWESWISDFRTPKQALNYFKEQWLDFPARFGLFKNSKLVGKLKVKRNKVEVIK